MERKKRFSILKLLIVILCVTSIVVSLAANILFRGNNVPNLFGRVIYIVEEDNPMSGDITTGAALISKEAGDLTVAAGDIVLCYPADDPETLCLRSVSYVMEAEDGTERYFTKDSYHEDNVDSITKDKIVSVCTGYPESKELGRFISFALNMKGILIMLVAASVILIVLIISAVLKSRGEKDEEEEDYEFYEYDEEEDEKEKSRRNSHVRSSDPLFEPNPELQPTPEFERKKMSIAENFKPKQVNPDSPYQKEKERTMQFKAQRGNTMSFSTSSAESSFAARNKGGQSSTAPTADALREEMLRKTAEAERTGTFNIKSSEPITDNTGVLSKSQVAELSRGETTSASRPAVSRSTASAPRKSSSPDISDILGKSSGTRRTKSPSDMSVDDLLKMIENEKKKL